MGYLRPTTESEEDNFLVKNTSHRWYDLPLYAEAYPDKTNGYGGRGVYEAKKIDGYRPEIHDGYGCVHVASATYGVSPPEVVKERLTEAAAEEGLRYYPCSSYAHARKGYLRPTGTGLYSDKLKLRKVNKEDELNAVNPNT